jgi:hypothetical protein
MQFEIKNLTRNQNELMRAIGYRPAFFQKEGEVSLIRLINGSDYPRFHLYIKGNPTSPTGSSGQMETKNLIFSLHLDQKKPSYEGSRGHSGEYDGPLVEQEAERIKNILNNA